MLVGNFIAWNMALNQTEPWLSMKIWPKINRIRLSLLKQQERTMFLDVSLLILNQLLLVSFEVFVNFGYFVNR